MRTCGRHIRHGERSRAICDRCGALWDRRQLRIDGEGMLVCPDEGWGRDGATLTRLNAECSRSYADKMRARKTDAGRYDKETATPIPGQIGSITGTF